MQSIPVWLDVTLRVFGGLLVPAIAGFAVYIAKQQYRTAERKLRLDLFDRRLAVFNSVMKFLAEIVRDANADLNQLFTLVTETRDAEFLFDSEISAYINGLYTKALELRTKHAVGDYKGDPQLLQWFSEQLKDAKEQFRKYLHFPQP